MKILNMKKVVRKQQVEHTLDEKRILFACNHPNIVKIHSCFKDLMNLYFLLDLHLFGDLYNLLRSKKRFDEEDAKFYAANVFLALEYLHGNNVIYRDLKPENLLVSNKGYLVLTDFGFAKCFSDASSAHTSSICGTPDYFSPE
jgi:protein kinase A